MLHKNPTIAPYASKPLWLLVLLLVCSQLSLADSRCAGYSSGERKNARLTEESCGSDQQFVTAAILSGAALFDFDSDELSTAGANALQKLIRDLAEFQQIRGIKIIGHTDSSGPTAYNLYLSEIRAKTIARYFTTAFPTIAVETIGKGESEPVAANTSRAGRYKNRRVKIEVTAIQ